MFRSIHEIIIPKPKKPVAQATQPSAPKYTKKNALQNVYRAKRKQIIKTKGKR
jgi:hypothetical protein